MVGLRSSFALALVVGSALGACAAELGADPDLDCAGKCDGVSGPSLAGAVLSASDRERIAALLAGAVELRDTPAPLFVLHDTAGATSSSYMQQQVDGSLGPLGPGPAAWLSAADLHLSRPFFDPGRPTASQFEKGRDLLSEATTLRLGRALWRALPVDQRAPTVAAVLAPFPLHPADRQWEQDETLLELDGQRDRLLTTAIWALELLCSFSADPACAELAPSFAARRDRVARSVNVEIGQLAGSHCAARGAPLSRYSDAVYDNLALAYLRAALVAGSFPETTTHFALDAAFGGHCDPRCLDLDRLYRTIADRLGHDPTTRYGVPPSYGTTYGTHTIWWSPSVCGPPPR